MVNAGNRFGLLVLLLSLACPQVLLGLDTALRVRQFSRCALQGDVGPDWLVRRGPDDEHRTMLPLGLEDCGSAMFAAPSIRFAQNGVGSVTSGRGTSPWMQAGIYGLEFVGGSAGTALATILPATMISASLGGEGGKAAALGLAAFPIYAASSAFASAAGTYFVGKLFGQDGSYWRTLAGGAVGGLLGSVSIFSSLSSGGRGALGTIGLLLPQTCSVIVYNVRRKHGTE